MSTHNNQKRTRSNDNQGNKNKRWKNGGANQPYATQEETEVDPAAQEQALKAYMHHAVKLLHKAVKKSKTFEVQKLTRKVKQTREPKDGKADETLAKDLDAQLTALKKLDINAIPPHLLSTRIAKLGPLRSVPYLPYLIAVIPKKPAWVEYDPSSAESKARNRILANKAVGEAWDEIVRAVRKRLGEEVEPKETNGKGKGKAVEEPPRKGMTMDPGRQAAIEAAFLQGREDAAEDGGEADEGEEGVEAANDADEETSEDEGPVAGFSSGEEEGSEMDDDEAIQRELAALGGDDSASEGAWSGSEDEAEDVDSEAEGAPSSKKRRKLSLSPPPAPTSKKAKAAAAAAAAKPITSSSFLPSLAAGYISYSDSDGEEARWIKDEERKDQKDKRKNRRGQRARQAIWEKKYGSAAAHVVKANGGKPVPLAKVKEQKAKRAERQRNAPPAAAPQPHQSAPTSNGDAAPRRHQFQEPKADIGWKKREEVKAAEAAAEKVHPSWEAKRKAAEALKQSAAMKPQGKKITFD
ncbi:hypothetical protein JCM10908_000922 [Rhodotorula pacifica]|uniref:Bud22p n=1 Tax=Rhodotorula pacifica TaxID=1495444 RepID=UPI0031774C43